MRYAMAAIHKCVAHDELVFKFSQEVFRKAWWASLKRLGLEWVGPPHCLRHAGPSHHATRGTKTLEDIRRRGRWSQAKSVQRYAKPHALTMHYARLPAGMKQQGRELGIQLPAILRAAVPAQHPWATELQAALLPLLRAKAHIACRLPGKNASQDGLCRDKSLSKG